MSSSNSARPDEVPSHDVTEVRRLFSRVARVSESAFLRREIAARMQEKLALVKIAPGLILDAGCGDSPDRQCLQQRYPAAQAIGIDASAAMLHAAIDADEAASSSLSRWLDKLKATPSRKRRGRQLSICGDFGHLPLPNAACDLVWSNLALHWHPRPWDVLAEWRRVLQPNGLLMFSCFGPDTFKQLRVAVDASGEESRLMAFADMHDLGDMLVQGGFATPVMDMENITLTYTDASRLLHDVWSFGGSPVEPARRSLTGKARWQKRCDALERSRSNDGLIHLTVEVIYGHAFVPLPSISGAGEKIVRFHPRS